MSSFAPPPAAPGPNPEFGQPAPDNNGAPVPNAGVNGPISPMPGGDDQGKTQDAMRIMAVQTNLNGLANDHPTIVQEVQQINDLMQAIQMKLLQAQPPVQPVAPPV